MSDPTFITNFNQFCTHCQLTPSQTAQHYLQLCTRYEHQLNELEQAYYAGEEVADEGRACEERLATAQIEAINALGIFLESTLDEQSQEKYKWILWEELQRKPEELNHQLLHGILLRIWETSEPQTKEIEINLNETALIDSIDQPFVGLSVPSSLESLWHQLEWMYVDDLENHRVSQAIGFGRREFRSIKQNWTRMFTLSRQNRSTSSHPSQTNTEKTKNTKKVSGLSKPQQAEMLYYQLHVMAKTGTTHCNLEAYFLDMLREREVTNRDIQAIDQFLQSNPEESFNEKQFVDAFYYIRRYGTDQTKKNLNRISWEHTLNAGISAINGLQMIQTVPLLIIPTAIQSQHNELFTSKNKKGRQPFPQPFFWQIDHRRAYRIVQEMSVNWLILNMPCTRCTETAESIRTLKEFLPNKGLILLKHSLEAFTNAKQLILDQHKKAEHKKEKGLLRFLFGRTNRLLTAYQTEHVNLYQKLFEQQCDQLQEIVKRLDRWFTSDEGKETRKGDMIYIKASIDQKVEFLKAEQAQLETMVGKSLANRFALRIDHSYQFIQQRIKMWEDQREQLLAQYREEEREGEREEERETEEQETERNKEQTRPNRNDRISYLIRLSEGQILDSVELTLLCANAAADPVQLFVERKKYHDQLEQRIRQILQDIQTRGTIITEYKDSLSQMIKYFQSISYESPLRTIRNSLSTLQHALPTEWELSALINQIGFLTEDWDTQVQKDLRFARQAAKKTEEAFFQLLKKVRQEPAPLYCAFEDAYRKTMIFQERTAKKFEKKAFLSYETVKQNPIGVDLDSAEQCIGIKYGHDYCRQLIQAFEQAIVSGYRRYQLEEVADEYTNFIKPSSVMISSIDLDILYQHHGLMKHPTKPEQIGDAPSSHSVLIPC